MSKHPGASSEMFKCLDSSCCGFLSLALCGPNHRRFVIRTLRSARSHPSVRVRHAAPRARWTFVVFSGADRAARAPLTAQTDRRRRRGAAPRGEEEGGRACRRGRGPLLSVRLLVSLQAGGAGGRCALLPSADRRCSSRRCCSCCCCSSEERRPPLTVSTARAPARPAPAAGSASPG